MATPELSFDQLQRCVGGVDDSKLAKILKPKPKKKEVKALKPFVHDLESAVKWGASPGPIYEIPKYVTQQYQQYYQPGY